jgi:hypothetical protein
VTPDEAGKKKKKGTLIRERGKIPQKTFEGLVWD